MDLNYEANISIQYDVQWSNELGKHQLRWPKLLLKINLKLFLANWKVD